VDDESDGGGEGEGSQGSQGREHEKNGEAAGGVAVHGGEPGGGGKPAPPGAPAAPSPGDHDAGGEVTFYSIMPPNALAHPGKCYALVSSIPSATLRQFAREMSTKATRELAAELLSHATQAQLSKVVAPILNDPKLQPSVVALCKAGALETKRILPIIQKIPPANISALLKAPPEVLVGVASGLDSGRFHAIVLPILQEPVAFTTMFILPVLRRVERPELVGRLLNRVEASVVMAFIHKTPTQQLVAVLNSLAPGDVYPSSNLLQLLDHAAASPELLQGVLIPLAKQADAAKSLTVVREVEMDRLLHFLFRVDLQDIVRLLEHANLGIIIRTLNGPLGEMEEALANMASGLGYVLRSRLGTKAVQASSHGCDVGLTKVGSLIREIRKPGDQRGSYDWIY